MKLQPAVKKMTLRIGVGTAIAAAIILLMFALLERFSMPVLLSTLIASVIAVVNFLLLGITVQKAAAQEDPIQAKKMVQASYHTRMLLILVWLIIAVAAPCFNWLAAALPLLAPRATIAVMQITGNYEKDDETSEQAHPSEEE